MLALDQFVLWVNADTPYKSARSTSPRSGRRPQQVQDGRYGLQAGRPDPHVGLEGDGHQFIYVPFKGGGDVAVQLVGKHVDSTVNNPIEAVAQWRAGSCKPLCVFDDERMPYPAKVTDTQSWNDIHTCRKRAFPTDTSCCVASSCRQVTKDQVEFYVNLLKKVRETPGGRTTWRRAPSTSPFMTGAFTSVARRGGRAAPHVDGRGRLLGEVISRGSSFAGDRTQAPARHRTRDGRPASAEPRPAADLSSARRTDHGGDASAGGRGGVSTLLMGAWWR